MEAKELRIERTNVLGVGISAINLPLALETLDAWIKRKHRTYVCITGVHGVMESQADPELRKIHNQAGLVTPDGMPMVWMSRLAGHQHVDRVYGPDLMLAVCEASAHKGYRHYFYGGNEGVPELLRDKLREKFPGLRVVGTYSPPFRPLTPEEDAAIVAQINAAQPDIIWVGLSTPKQERWMAAHLGQVQASVMIGVGAAFDFHAGLKQQAPRWMQRSGMEWFFRMVSEPRRLARRYLQNNPRFVMAVLMQLLGLRRYKLDI
jgi:N-acetylglucosaminyldiphosphoundecaprenol N-acetyl-beta-D-mannosaminyltransferase